MPHRLGVTMTSHAATASDSLSHPLTLTEVCNFSLESESEYASGLSSYVSSLTFLEPAKPSDSVKKYAKGIRKMRDRLEKRKTRFQRPRAKKEKQSWSLRGQSRWAT